MPPVDGASYPTLRVYPVSPLLDQALLVIVAFSCFRSEDAVKSVLTIAGSAASTDLPTWKWLALDAPTVQKFLENLPDAVSAWTDCA